LKHGGSTINNNKSIDEAKIREIIKKTPIDDLDEEEKSIIWEARSFLKNRYPNELAKLMLSVPASNPAAIQEAHKVLKEWPDVGVEYILELLHHSICDTQARLFAVSCFKNLPKKR